MRDNHLGELPRRLVALGIPVLALKWKCHRWSGGRSLVLWKNSSTAGPGRWGNRSSKPSFSTFSVTIGAGPTGIGLGIVPFGKGVALGLGNSGVGLSGLRGFCIRVRR